MAVSWAKRIAVTEPAPKIVRYARYLAPHWQGLLRIDSENGIGLVPAAVFFGAVAALVFGAGGGGAALLVDAALGRHYLPRSWPAFDAAAAIALSFSYWLVGRYGLRFYDTDPASNDLWRMITVANTAWRSLPRAHRAAQKPRLRAANTAARILLADPDDARTRQTLAVHADALRQLAITVLSDARRGKAEQVEEAASFAITARPAGPGTASVADKGAAVPQPIERVIKMRTQT
ncbi:hypothetical protein [Streptomyces varsoviensis]|uniref:hypothetical protein n=1 Tax=Streptomyces varsoviensis TaxID=67373 RepID=UPI0004CA7091|nr:hypothetical protein [Streptomyces varsoviensis]